MNYCEIPGIILNKNWVNTHSHSHSVVGTQISCVCQFIPFLYHHTPNAPVLWTALSVIVPPQMCQQTFVVPLSITSVLGNLSLPCGHFLFPFEALNKSVFVSLACTSYPGDRRGISPFPCFYFSKALVLIACSHTIQVLHRDIELR